MKYLYFIFYFNIKQNLRIFQRNFKRIKFKLDLSSINFLFNFKIILIIIIHHSNYIKLIILKINVFIYFLNYYFFTIKF